MVKAEDAVIARLIKAGSHFEVLVDPKVVQDIKSGKQVDLREKLAQDHIYKDAKKGDKISDEYLQKQFHTIDVYTIALEIIRQGEVQITTEQKRVMVEEKRKQVVDYIARNAINPQTNTPHPPARISAALEEAKFHVDPFKDMDSLAEDAMAKLRPILPIRLEHIKIRIKVEAAQYPRIVSDVKAAGKILEEEWGSDGSWTGLVEIPGGVQTALEEKLKNKTHGQAEVTFVGGLGN
ncbi:MAG: ribosome assembly factor SBDS [Candidatus Thermoplasmatota archaeon]|jgi:ribosome maturation protein SDO1|nr:ribosome assembly factor SBDS [Candidatus Thermoplasmatota archaeon]MCL5984831.1 ribosome assembly factor SBDS [Candidatus Thermoplasmatota archaeon]